MKITVRMKQIALAAVLVLTACVTPSEVKEKISLEAAVHQGYLRLESQGASREDLAKMLKASAKAWATLDQVVNDAGAREGDADVAPVTSGAPDEGPGR
jgi:hypothetical protein